MTDLKNKIIIEALQGNYDTVKLLKGTDRIYELFLKTRIEDRVLDRNVCEQDNIAKLDELMLSIFKRSLRHFDTRSLRETLQMQSLGFDDNILYIQYGNRASPLPTARTISMLFAFLVGYKQISIAQVLKKKTPSIVSHSRRIVQRIAYDNAIACAIVDAYTICFVDVNNIKFL